MCLRGVNQSRGLCVKQVVGQDGERGRDPEVSGVGQVPMAGLEGVRR